MNHNDHTHTGQHSEHSHHQTEPHSPEELKALLGYMVTHNRHHASELEELATQTDGEASILLTKAIAAFNEGNDFLSQALSLLQKGEN